MYLVVLTAGEYKPIPTHSLILIAAIYGLQAFVFVNRHALHMGHVGWMVFYILVIPAFSFFLPLYSFWRMDDFSLGQTQSVRVAPPVFVPTNRPILEPVLMDQS
jgi:chitin synthase